MKRIILALIPLFGISNLNAKNNRIEIGVGNYKLYVDQAIDPFPHPIETINISYERTVYKNITAYVSYMGAPINKAVLMMDNQLYEKQVGELFTRLKHHYFDIGGGYKFFKIKQHQFSIRGGLSLVLANNQYYTYGNWMTEFPYSKEHPHVIYLEFYDTEEVYIGGALNIKYDYTFWKDRLNLGINFGARKYLNKNNPHLEMKSPELQYFDPNIPGGRHSFPFQINYGIHLGFNF